MPSPWADPGYLKLIWVQSPNWNHRPAGAVVDTVVVHSTVIPTLQATTEAFYRESSQVSAHFTIGRDGSIVQNVSTFERGWHAGVSVDAFGRGNVNDFSIGIELVNLNDGADPYPLAQTEALGSLISALRRRFPLRYVTSHAMIARPLGRKSDPKAFPWDRLDRVGLALMP
ncbi:MAG: N-acetylmuramoyl-L-alanine amidase [Fimbriimonas ginsengisoli]|uniref:N-acetylmuramoyl-L-alanine amidase n=1 Tax=Fimbriimonas ginsengisoli TaxID=1005039 RepID=A0A931LYJ4_FIMGI|nr:N-acetylmuramoyl-L-alanine amidase [Fimbriimonas ginsengisoli]